MQSSYRHEDFFPHFFEDTGNQIQEIAYILQCFLLFCFLNFLKKNIFLKFQSSHLSFWILRFQACCSQSLFSKPSHMVCARPIVGWKWEDVHKEHDIRSSQWIERRNPAPIIFPCYTFICGWCLLVHGILKTMWQEISVTLLPFIEQENWGMERLHNYL